MKPTKNSARSLCRLLALAAVIFVFSMPAFAYGEDTHFIMTYILCRSVGFTREEALVVAAVDQGMDDSGNTRATLLEIIPRPKEEWLWHALDKGGRMRAAGVIAMRNELFEEALREEGPYKKLIRLGVFFHYQQDMWAHRSHGKTNHLSPDKYTTLNTPIGHGLFGWAPDGPPLDPVAALMCLEDGIGFARSFLSDKNGLNRKPTPFLADYKPQEGKIDTGWKKKGKYFNQIDVSGAVEDSAQKYLLELIYSQIEGYKKCLSPFFPHYFLRKTGGPLKVDRVREKLQPVFTKYGSHLLLDPKDREIPTKGDKEDLKFRCLKTSKLLLHPLPDEVPFIKANETTQGKCGSKRK